MDIKTMKSCGLITGSVKDGVALLALGKRNYNVPLNIELSKASEAAIEAVENTGKTYTAVYHTRLGLRAHLHPETFLLKRGHVPLQARPTHKRDIGYYSNPDKRGYLLKQPELLLDHIEQAQLRPLRKEKINQLDRQLDNVSSKKYSEFEENRTVDASAFL